jgi:glycosyltransferase involved in cell wall biosynthesis
VLSKYPSALLSFLSVRGLIKRIKPDILDCHYITLQGYLGAFSGFYPLVLTAWGSDVHTDPRRNPLYRILTKRAIKKADLIVCDSQFVKKGLMELGAVPSKIRVIYNGVDTHLFSPEKRDIGLRQELGLLDSTTIISTRTLSRLYNVRTLVEAVPLVVKEFPQARFIIAGDGKQRNYLTNLANSLGVSNSVRFLGWVPNDELPNYLALSDIYVSTSLADSTSVCLQEAMACELAPVVTDLPANREWVTDGENAFVVPTRDPQALAEKIIYLLSNEEVRRKFGKAGRKIIEERAEYEREMEKMEQLYQELADARYSREVKC